MSRLAQSGRVRAGKKPADGRTRLTIALQAAARAKGLICGDDRSLYDNVLDEVTGKRRTRDLTMHEIGRVLDRINGVSRAAPDARPGTSEPGGAKATTMATIEKLRQELGVPTSYLDGMARRMFQRQRLEFLTPSELHRISIALRIAANRHRNDAGRNCRET